MCQDGLKFSHFKKREKHGIDQKIGINVEQMFSSRHLFSLFLMFPLEKSHYYTNKYLLIKSLNVVLSCVIKLSIIALQLKEEDCIQIRKSKKQVGIYRHIYRPFPALSIQAKAFNPSSLLPKLAFTLCDLN